LLAADDVRRGDFAAAAARLAAPASPIGLEPYREFARAGALDRAGQRDAAIAAARRAFEAEGPLAYPVRAATLRARLLEEDRQSREASEVLALAADATSTSAETVDVAVERIRVGLGLGDRQAVQDAARTMLLEAPTADADRSLPAFARRAAAEA